MARLTEARQAGPVGLFGGRELEDVLGMRLARFIVSGMAIELGGSFLPGQIWIAADRVVADNLRREHPEAAVYTGVELGRLADERPCRETLHAIHEAKRIFGGRLVKLIKRRERWGNPGDRFFYLSD